MAMFFVVMSSKINKPHTHTKVFSLLFSGLRLGVGNLEKQSNNSDLNPEKHWRATILIRNPQVWLVKNFTYN